MTVLALQFASFPLWGVLLGLAAIAALMFVLHRLRIRFREEVVPTTMFWQEALDDRQARVLMQRFRHPWTYALATAIAALLWFGFAQPTTDADPSAAKAIVLWDLSADGYDADRTRAAVKTLAERLSGQPLSVIGCHDDPSPLLAEGESVELLAPRLQAMASRRCDSSIERVLSSLSLTTDAAQRIDAYVVGNIAPVSMDVAWGKRVRVRSVHVSASSDASPPALHAFVVTPSASGRWDRVDVALRVSPDATWSARVGEEPLAFTERTPTEFVARDVAADGRTLTVQFGDAQTSRVLPSRSVIGVSMSVEGSAASGVRALRALLEMDRGLELGSDKSDVQVNAGGGGDSALPTLAVVAESAFTGLRMVVPASQEHEARDFARSWRFHDVDRRQPNGHDFEELTFDVVVDANIGAPRIEVSDLLFGPRSNFVRSDVFPPFVASALRWLARQPLRLALDAVVGDAQAAPSGVVTRADGQRSAAIDNHYTPTVDGVYRFADGRVIAASKLTPISTHAANDAASNAVKSGDVWAETVSMSAIPSTSRAWPLAWIMSFLALVLLLVEWFLVRRGRIP